MRTCLPTLLAAGMCLCAGAQNPGFAGRIAVPDQAECDTVVDVDGYSVRIIKENGGVGHIGLHLFADEAKLSADGDLLGYLEEAMLARCMDIGDERYAKVVVRAGSPDDFRNITPDTPCSVTTVDSKTMTVEWTVADGEVAVTMPVGYDTAAEGTRSEIENSFIARLGSSTASRPKFGRVDTGGLVPYGEDKYLYPGSKYQSKDVTRNIYFETDSLNPVWDAEFPLESMANLFIYPADGYADPEVELTILKHEYGEKRTVTLPLSRLLAVCEDEGCMAYWGVENYADGVLTGALFMYNRRKGYDHVFRIECSPAEVIGEGGPIKVRGSLFIPANNVYDLYSPYVRKTDKEKINYDPHPL